MNYIDKYKDEIIAAIERGEHSIEFEDNSLLIEVEMEYKDLSESVLCKYPDRDISPEHKDYIEIRDIVVTAYITEIQTLDDIIRVEYNA